MLNFVEENDKLDYSGFNYLRQRLILSILSGKPVSIKNIRPSKGIQEFEVSLIRLMDKITNGTKIELGANGTSLLFVPGFLEGGSIQHECNTQRNIGYYLDALIALGPFCKTPIHAVLTGVTNSNDSPSVDYIKSSTFNLLLKYLVVNDGLDLKINKRGLMPLGGGEVVFRCPVKKELKALQISEFGKIKRIRGTAFSCKVPASVINRTVESAKGVLLNFLPDIYIYTDQNKGKLSGKSPGFGIHLLAETNTGIIFSAEGISECTTNENSKPTVPEELGPAVANKLIEEIYRNGCVDSSYQWLAVLYMALSQKDVSKFVTGMISEYTVAMLQHLKEFFGVTFKIDFCENYNGNENALDIIDSPKVNLTCVGIGYKNTNKRVI